jgi:subtilisin family serine protease
VGEKPNAAPNAAATAAGSREQEEKASGSHDTQTRVCHMMHGFVVRNLKSEALLSLIRGAPGVRSVRRTRTYRLHGSTSATRTSTRTASTGTGTSTSTSKGAGIVPQAQAKLRSWGLDRIDQQSLPLDGAYQPRFDGSGSHVFIVDTGIDTLHAEFAVQQQQQQQPQQPQQPQQQQQQQQQRKNVVSALSSSSSASFPSSSPAAQNQGRVVENLFDAYSSNVTPNNDAVGHGTHCAGTVGGVSVGVSPRANIHGVRILDEHGAGEDYAIIAGLGFVLEWYETHGKPPTVVSMSLGGDCLSYEDCEEDPLVEAVELLVRNGIVVTVAAGNSDCDSCLQTPAFAPHALTIGASTSSDQAAFFSDFGKCVNLYAPGLDITSACASSQCGDHSSYKSLSGTSMACPHVAGAVAQYLQKYSVNSVSKANKRKKGEKTKTLRTMTEDGIKDLKIDTDTDTDTINNPEGGSPPAPGNQRALSLSLSLSVPSATQVGLYLACESARGKLSLPVDNLQSNATRNLLLQVPSTSLADGHCDLGASCFANCSGHGLCQKGQCLCDTGYFGPGCRARRELDQCEGLPGQQYVRYTLHDTLGGGLAFVCLSVCLFVCLWGSLSAWLLDSSCLVICAFCFATFPPFSAFVVHFFASACCDVHRLLLLLCFFSPSLSAPIYIYDIYY